MASDSRKASLSRILEPVGADDLRAGDELIEPGASEDSLAPDSTLYSEGSDMDTDRGMVLPDFCRGMTGGGVFTVVLDSSVGVFEEDVGLV